MNKVVDEVNLINYISWLELFTELDSSFYDDSYLYRRDSLKEEEHGNAAKLGYFYKSIEQVLKDAEISPIVDNYQTYYFIKQHNTCLQIGYI